MVSCWYFMCEYVWGLNALSTKNFTDVHLQQYFWMLIPQIWLVKLQLFVGFRRCMLVGGGKHCWRVGCRTWNPPIVPKKVLQLTICVLRSHRGLPKSSKSCKIRPWLTGWWLSHPSEKWWSSSLGVTKFPIFLESHLKFHGSSHHQPDIIEQIYCTIH